MIRCSVVHGSLTEGDARVLVNASNTNGELGSGVSGAIRAACGAGFQATIHEALKATFGGPMAPGQVLITGAGSHPTARFVAHVAVMDYRQGFHAGSYPDLARIEVCCRNLWAALGRLEGAGPVSVAMVALGAGTGRLGVRAPTEIACRTLQEAAEALAGRVSEVIFYGYDLTEYLNMLDVVSAHFPLDEEGLDEDTRRYLALLRQERGEGPGAR